MKRTIGRIVAMFSLYAYDIQKKDVTEDILHLIDDEQMENIEYDPIFVHELVQGTLSNLREIDHIISLNLKNYTLDRLSYVDRSILRLGCYELLHTNTPRNIIINEMVELSKEYSELDDFPSSRFNNAVLDKIGKGTNHGK